MPRARRGSTPQRDAVARIVAATASRLGTQRLPNTASAREPPELPEPRWDGEEWTQCGIRSRWPITTISDDGRGLRRAIARQLACWRGAPAGGPARWLAAGRAAIA